MKQELPSCTVYEVDKILRYNVMLPDCVINGRRNRGLTWKGTHAVKTLQSHFGQTSETPAEVPFLGPSTVTGDTICLTFYRQHTTRSSDWPEPTAAPPVPAEQHCLCSQLLWRVAALPQEYRTTWYGGTTTLKILLHQLQQLQFFPFPEYF